MSDLCFSHGATGVSEELLFSQSGAKYDPQIELSGVFSLVVYFATSPDENFFIQLRTLCPSMTYVLERQPNRDWLEEWKKGFEPFCLAADFWVVPTWCQAPVQAKRVIWMDPGMAFGTGTHATTQIAAQVITGVSSEIAGSSIIDVGTGTGILAFMAHMLGAQRILGTEIDAAACAAAEVNRQRNSCFGVDLTTAELSQVHEQFNFVIANIIDGVLLELRADLLRVLASGGTLVLTGILVEREEAFRHEFLTGTSLKILQRLQKDEWVGLVLRRS